MSRKLVNVFENREMRFGFLVLCFALMGHRRKVTHDYTSKRRENIWENKWFLAISQMARHNICSPDNLSEVCKV